MVITGYYPVYKDTRRWYTRFKRCCLDQLVQQTQLIFRDFRNENKSTIIEWDLQSQNTGFLSVLVRIMEAVREVGLNKARCAEMGIKEKEHEYEATCESIIILMKY